MASKYIYIVEGCTGEYSDYTSWNVAAYIDKAMAEEHAKLARQYAPQSSWSYKQQDSAKNPYDSNMRSDYTGTQYNVLTVELLDAVPALQV